MGLRRHAIRVVIVLAVIGMFAAQMPAGAGETELTKRQLAAVNGTFGAETDITHADPIEDLRIRCTNERCSARGPASDELYTWLMGTSGNLILRRIPLAKLPSATAYQSWDALRGDDLGRQRTESTYDVPARSEPPAPVIAAWDHISKPVTLRNFRACTPSSQQVSTSVAGPWSPCAAPAVEDEDGNWRLPDGSDLDLQWWVVASALAPRATYTENGARAKVARDFSPEFAASAEIVRECRGRVHRTLTLSEDLTVTVIAWMSPVGKCPTIPSDRALNARFLFDELVAWTWTLDRERHVDD